MRHTVFYGSPGFGKSLALQTLVLNLARLNTPEQVQINLFDFGTNGLLPLKDLPHVVDLTRFDEEEKLVKFLKRIDQELKIRKEKFAIYNVASLSQYEQKSGEKLPAILTIFDGFDTIKDTALEEAIESMINRLLREGASLGCYVILTALRSNSLKISMSSNITSRLAFYLVDEGASKEIIGRDALIQQEIFGRAQLKEDIPYAIQVYLPTSGEGDIERLYNLEEEVKLIARSWTGVCPEPIPMLPNEVTLTHFSNHPKVLEMWSRGELPIGFDKETTDPQGFVPDRDGYFEFLYDTPQQLEYCENSLIPGLNRLVNIEKILLNTNNSYKKTEVFDKIIDRDNIPSFFNDIQGEIESRHNGKEASMMYVFIPEAHMLGALLNMKITEDVFKKIVRNSGKVHIHFVFMGEQQAISVGYLDVDKVLKSNVPAGCVGTRFKDQNISKVQTSFSEPVVAEDETNFFVGRIGYRLRLVTDNG